MSWWTNFRDAAEGVLTGGVAGEFNDSLANKEGALFNAVTGRKSAAEKRNDQSLINDQIQAYKQQTDITNKQLGEIESAKNIERRRIQEKQIRSLRNSYRSSNGFLNNQSNSAQANISGGSPGISNKLGTT